jgi:hypothetical protein
MAVGGRPHPAPHRDSGNLALAGSASASRANDFDAISQQQHQLFPTIDLNLSPKWEFNFGVGWGLTPATDHLIVKCIVDDAFRGPATRAQRSRCPHRARPPASNIVQR